jgi:hypothetical protein
MKTWHSDLPETKRFVVLPPIGLEQEVAASKERLTGYLGRLFPDLEFDIGLMPIDDEFAVFPICGAAGEGDRIKMLAPPPASTMNEIEEALRGFDPARTGLS